MGLENYRMNKILIRESASFCRDHQIHFILASVPLAYDAKTRQAKQEFDPTFDPSFFENDLRELASDLGAQHLGLQRPFEEYSERTGRSLNLVHFNYEGHRLVAEAIIRNWE